MKFSIEYGVMKSILDDIAAFRTKSNSAAFTIGIKDPSGNTEKLASSVTVVNKGMQVTKAFYVPMPAEYEPLTNEDGSVVPFLSFAVKAERFSQVVGSLLAYESDILIDVNGNSAVLSVGTKATFPVDLVGEDQLEPVLPQENKKAIAMVALKTSNFNMLARKGGFLYAEDEAHHFADRVLFTLSGDAKIEIYSTNVFSMAKAWCDAKIQYKEGNLFTLLLNQKLASLTGEKKETFEKALADIKDAAALEAFAKENDLGHEFSFSLLSNAFKVLRNVVSGTENFCAIVTDNYLYVNAGSIMATFTLGNSIPRCYSAMDSFESLPVVASVALDTEELSRGLSILNLAKNNATGTVPVSLSLNKSSLSLSCNGSSIKIPYVENKGELKSQRFLSVDYLREITDSLDKGNVVLEFREENRIPLCIHNGTLEGKSNSVAYCFLVNAPKKVKETKKTEDDAPSEEE